MRQFSTTIALLLLSSALIAEDATLKTARELYLKGRYEEAQESYEEIAGDHPIEAAIGRSFCLQETGQREAAASVVAEAAKKHPKSAALQARLAELAFERGEPKVAAKHVAEALKVDADTPLAHWVAAELAVTTGKIDQAEKEYEWFLTFYKKAKEPPSAEVMLLIGKAAAQLARWNRNQNQFRQLVNEIYPGVIEREPNFWPAHLEAARLFAEKYNGPEAAREVTAALAINPNAAEVYALQASLAMNGFSLASAKRSIQAALEINDQCVAAHLAAADMYVSQFRDREANQALAEAKKLNAIHEPTLGRIAAMTGVAEGFGDDSSFHQLAKQATERNDHCGEFFRYLAETLNARRKYPHCVRWYEEAHKRMPELLGVNSELGLVYMRLGEETKAARVLEAAFREDPFNVRVKNTLEVLDVLNNYAVLETDHFIIRFDRGKDELLAQYAADYLEGEVFPEVVARFGFEPPEKSLIEIFSRARNTSGHGWFSARMVGLPFIGTVGACAGKMVALASPNDGKQQYNWARVLKHEFVHVVNLQQTDFNVPHWYTEALAVSMEGFPRPPEWNLLLLKRLAEDRLFTLETINFGFAVPGGGDDWTLAYCQAELYADYISEQFGEESHGKLLNAFAAGKSTTTAIESVCQISVDEFEKGYLEFLRTIAADIGGSQQASPATLAELQKRVEANPQDAQAHAEIAAAWLDRQELPKARLAAVEAQKLNPKSSLAAYVLARVLLTIGDAKTAYQHLKDSLDGEPANPRHLDLLAGFELKSKRYAEAERLYKLAAKTSPHPDKWLKRLAKVYLTTGDNDELKVVLAKLADQEWDNTLYRKKLAEIALADDHSKAAADWLTQVIHINVNDASTHAKLGEVYAKMNEPAQACVEYKAALRLRPDSTPWRIEYTRSLIAADQRDTAREQLQMLEEADVDDDILAGIEKELN